MLIALDRSARSIDANGHLHIAMANIAKAKVDPYRGDEIPGWQELGLDPQRIYRLLRDPVELAKAADSFRRQPILRTHTVTSADTPAQDDIVGTIGSDVAWEAPYLRGSLTVWNGDAIAAIEADLCRELSPAYRYDPVMEPGVFEGVPYHGRMTNIRANHLALVPDGRQGSDVVVPDSIERLIPMRKPALSRQATLAKGALSVTLKPVLAKDAKLDLNPILLGVTAKNFGAKKPVVAERIRAALAGKLAQDAEIGDVVEKVVDLLDAMDPTEPDGDEKTTTMDEPDGSPEERAREMLRAKGFSDEEIATISSAFGAPAAQDAEGGEGNREGAPAIKPKMVDTAAMDAAIRRAATEGETRALARFNELRDAERIVRPLVGDITVAMDSAEAVFRFALEQAGEDLDGVPPSAFGPMVRTILKHRSAAPPKPTMARDSAAEQSAAERHRNPYLKVA